METQLQPERLIQGNEVCSCTHNNDTPTPSPPTPPPTPSPPTCLNGGQEFCQEIEVLSSCQSRNYGL